MNGNIPCRGPYGVYASQLVHFCDINKTINAFINNIKWMTVKFLNQGFERQRLNDVYASFTTKYSSGLNNGVDITSLVLISLFRIFIILFVLS